MKKLLIILSPPRSFSSVVSTTIGEHPELYTFPELRLFVGDTVREVIKREHHTHPDRYVGPPGLLRTLAQLHEGIQTNVTVMRAAAWLNDRLDWPTNKLLDYLLDKISPKMGIEKSPANSTKFKYLKRICSFYPEAYFLHLTRHPVPFRKSALELIQHGKTRKIDRKKISEPLIAWYRTHSNIINLTDSLAPAQSMRIKGEDLLSEPDVYLPQIAEWLGLRTDRAAIEAMKHPENSPYACMGPARAVGGNDPKFMRSPRLRSGKVKEPSLKDFLSKEQLEWVSPDLQGTIELAGLNCATDPEFSEKIINLAKILGYQ